MKRYLLFFFLFTAVTIAQTYDEPTDSTTHYHLRKYAQSAHVPNTVLNGDKDIIDSVLYSLIVYTDTLQLVIRNDTLIFSPYSCGQDTFSTTNTSDSVAVTGFDSLDILTVTPLSTSYNVNDILFVEKRTGYFKVYRNAGGSSGLIFNWAWRRKYQ